MFYANVESSVSYKYHMTTYKQNLRMKFPENHETSTAASFQSTLFSYHIEQGGLNPII